MIWPENKRCHGCEFRGGQACCPRCMYPGAPNDGYSHRFCPKKEAQRLARELKNE